MVYIPSLSAALAFITLATSVQAASKTCTAKSGTSDDAVSIAEAFNSCKSGGTVVFTKGATYNLKTLINISGLKNVNVQFYGKVNLPALNTKYEGATAFFKIAGDNIHWDGAGIGEFVGGGQKWWDVKNNKAPTVFRMTATHSVFRDFKITAAPRAHMALTSSDDVVLEKVVLYTKSSNSNLPKNTDALDISSSKNLIFRDSDLTVGDDCTAINGGVSNVTLSNIHCVGGHGFSVGSLGKGGSTETVKQIRVTGSTCTKCQNGIRIKTWSGGKGSVSDVRFEHVKLNKVENPIIIDEYYCDNNQKSYCQKNSDKSLTISNVVINDITGSVSEKKNPIMSINCAPGTPCSGFSVSNVNISKNSKTTKNVCNNLKGSDKISYCKQ
ncbi:glycoside hydrolase family 28 protein [Mucor lusitanicus]|uniref:Glycoside hydrolase family 28 protein n=2 Tax=Mucor circinelloides f. lusitanicus TaxID=29924 RepID=A0A168HH02_MUCCL|nr:glycoside hydrolase family 28 protein [Mucor lusitanicus]OAC98773.1 glycoside hydrolase family 28 protein [Mucor lusitanicus CBS 277.49]